MKFLSTVGGVDAKQVERNSVHDNVRLIYERAMSTTLPKEQRVSIKDAFFLTVQVLEGLDVATVEDAATTAVMKGSMGQPGIIDRFHTDASGCGTKALISKMKQRGMEIYFLSATLDVLARAAAKAVDLPARSRHRQHPRDYRWTLYRTGRRQHLREQGSGVASVGVGAAAHGLW